MFTIIIVLTNYITSVLNSKINVDNFLYFIVSVKNIFLKKPLLVKKSLKKGFQKFLMVMKVYLLDNKSL